MTYTQAQIDKANAVDLEKFLRAQGETLVRSGKEYRWKAHDSLTVCGNKWFRQSAQQNQRLLLRSWACSCFLWDGAYGTPPMFFDGFSITRVFCVRKRCSL